MTAAPASPASGTAVFNELTNGRYVTLARSDLSRLLFEKIAGDVEVLFDEQLVRLEETSSGVTAQLARTGTRQFDLVIGADGLHSQTRSLAFGPQQRFEHSLGYTVAAFEAPGYRPRDEDAYVLRNRPGLMAGRFAMRDDRTLLLLVFASEDFDASADPPTQKRLLRDRLAAFGWETTAILDALDRTEDLYVDRVSQIKLDAWSRGRVALVGDAAFCISLMGGQGTALGNDRGLCACRRTAGGRRPA